MFIRTNGDVHDMFIRTNGDVHDMFINWMRDNNTTNWYKLFFTVSEKQTKSCRNKVITIRDYV
jgi:hypothetical protein